MDDRTKEDGSPIEFSATIGALAAALAKAQGEIQDAKKDCVNTFFKKADGKGTPYSSLSAIRAAVTPAFAKHGLAVAQPFEPHGLDAVCIVTLLMHTSGEWIKSRLVVPLSKKDAQGMGSAITYGRRYALAAIANVASDDDDDGNEAAKPGPTKAAKVEANAPPAESGVDVDALAKAMRKAPDENALTQAILAAGRVKERLTKEQVAMLNNVREEEVRRIHAGRAA
jgi:hypothetical protein